MSRDPDTLEVSDQGIDELGFTSGLPLPHVAPSVQYLSEKKVAQRNAALMRAAYGRLGAGLNLMSSYRPGGVAALTSGLYQGQAQTLANSRTIAPDLMFFYRKRLRTSAEDSAKNAALVGGLIQGAATVAGAAVGGGPGAAAGSQIGGAAGDTVAQGLGGGGGGGLESFTPLPSSGGGLGAEKSQEAGTADVKQPGQTVSGGPQPMGAQVAAGGPVTGEGQPPGAEMAAGGSLFGAGMAGTEAMTQQLAADVGPTMAADILGSTKVEDDPEDRAGAFYDQLSVAIDNMANGLLQRVFAGAV